MKKLTGVLLLLFMVLACKKESGGGNNGGGGGGNPGGGSGNQNPVDPPTENTIGFFLNSWTPRTFTIPAYTDTSLPTNAATATVTIDASKIITKIPSSVFGHNANTWMSQIVTEVPLMNHMRNLKPGVIRFPGGSISDLYFWNAAPGQKPADVPATLLDANGNTFTPYYWYGKNEESWTISLRNYYNLLKETGSQGMITVNYGYARYGTGLNPVNQAAHLAANWVRHDSGRTKYWEIGNESNGTWEAGFRINTATNQDGQPAIINGALYGQHAKVFIDSMKKAAQEIGKTIYTGVYLLEKQPEAWQNQTDQTWNSGVLSQVGSKADFYVIHSYYTPYQTNSSADQILNSGTANTFAMMNYVKSNITGSGVTVKPIALTEWNIFAEGSMQQVSYINGMHATLVLAESIKNKYGMTARWDLANGWSNGNDHGLFNIGDEPDGVSKWNPRPPFYYMYYFQRMVGDRMLQTTATGASILAYGSSFSSGEKGVVLVNKTNSVQTVSVMLENAKAGSRFYWYTLTGGTDNGEFSRKVLVNGKGPSQASGGPVAEYTTLKAYSASSANGVKVNMPPRSVIYLVMDK